LADSQLWDHALNLSELEENTAAIEDDFAR